MQVKHWLVLLSMRIIIQWGYFFLLIRFRVGPLTEFRSVDSIQYVATILLLCTRIKEKQFKGSDCTSLLGQVPFFFYTESIILEIDFSVSIRWLVIHTHTYTHTHEAHTNSCANWCNPQKSNFTGDSEIVFALFWSNLFVLISLIVKFYGVYCNSVYELN